MLETKNINASILPILTELTITEQENTNGGQYGYRSRPYSRTGWTPQRNRAVMAVYPNGRIDTGYGDMIVTPSGNRIYDLNPYDDPRPVRYPPYPYPMRPY